MKKRFLIINDEKAPDVRAWVDDKKIDIYKQISNKVDRIDIAGGDGTFLGAIRRYWKRQIPFFGINRGTVGFLLNPVESVSDYISSFDSFNTISLNLLQALFILENGKEVVLTAFNDVYFVNMIPRSGCRGRIECFNDFKGDFDGNGIIVSTPQGSTAYTKAAGGNMLALTDGKLAITSICGFSMPIKEVSVAEEVEINFSRGKICGIADNKQVNNVKKAFVTVISNAVRIGFMEGYDFDLARYRMTSKMRQNVEFV